MKALYDFRCPEGHMVERFIDSNVRNVLCPKCGSEANRLIMAPSYFKIDGFRSDINSDGWAKRREDNAKRTKERNG